MDLQKALIISHSCLTCFIFYEALFHFDGNNIKRKLKTKNNKTKHSMHAHGQYISCPDYLKVIEEKVSDDRETI